MMSKPVNIAPTPGSASSPPSLSTHDWNIPPRPKPGRKPGGEAPPTKRKAQNREAQRAFRERRAARVGELEDQLKDFQKASQRENGELAGDIARLQCTLKHYSDQISSLQRRQADLESALAMERQMRQEAETRLEAMRRGSDSNMGRIPSPARKKVGSERSMEQPTDGMVGITCGECDNTQRCKCVEDLIEAEIAETQDTSSMYNALEASAPQRGAEFEEIDFTAQFASQRPGNSDVMTSKPAMDTMRITDPCGFCRNDTECICAAMTRDSTQPFLQNASQGEADWKQNITSNGSIKPKSCTNKPGTCDQCRSDPTSTVFCKTLAASRAQSEAAAKKDYPNDLINANAPSIETLAAVSGPTLSCADAFSALSRHHAFPQATEQLGSWVSQLTAVPANANTEGRTAFEIEAANVMSVLRFFDTRYGQAPRKPTDGET